jgi:hypothetical protein
MGAWSQSVLADRVGVFNPWGEVCILTHPPTRVAGDNVADSGEEGKPMAQNPAARKAAKAAKRKMVVAAKRKLEMAANSPAARLRQAAKLPVLKCLISSGLFSVGAGAALLIRGVSREEQHVACFMLDTFCVGVKDVFFRTLDRQEVEVMLASLQQADAVESTDPRDLRKLLHDLVAWSESNGFPPHEDYARVEALFGDIEPTDHDYLPSFGYEGRVIYIPGPSESPAQIRRRTELVRARFGQASVDTGVLDFELSLGCDDDDDDDDVVDIELLEEEESSAA